MVVPDPRPGRRDERIQMQSRHVCHFGLPISCQKKGSIVIAEAATRISKECHPLGSGETGNDAAVVRHERHTLEKLVNPAGTANFFELFELPDSGSAICVLLPLPVSPRNDKRYSDNDQARQHKPRRPRWPERDLVGYYDIE